MFVENISKAFTLLTDQNAMQDSDTEIRFHNIASYISVRCGASGVLLKRVCKAMLSGYFCLVHAIHSYLFAIVLFAIDILVDWDADISPVVGKLGGCWLWRISGLGLSLPRCGGEFGGEKRGNLVRGSFTRNRK